MIEFKLFKNPRITSKYGFRIHPIHKVQTFHNGVDLVSGTGEININFGLKCDSAKVIKAGYDKLNGNYIKVEAKIGKDIFILSFVHLKNAFDSDKIPYVLKYNEWFCVMGNTGASKGVHLHLTVRFNGVIVNPTNYFKFI